MLLKTWPKKRKTSLAKNRISVPDEYGSEREKDDYNSSDEDDLLIEAEGFSVSGGEFY